MADEETKQVASEPPGPASGGPRPDPGPEGQAASPPPSGRPSAGADLRRAPARQRTGGPRAFLAGAFGGLVVAAAALAGAYSLYPPRTELAEADANRLAAAETQAKTAAAAAAAQAQRDKDAVAGVENRLAALEAASSSSGTAALEKRIATLEAAAAADAPKIAAAADAARQAQSAVKDLRADAEGATKAIPALQSRVTKLESAAPQAASGAEVSALSGRIDKIEAALAAQRQALVERARAEDNVAAVGIVADALRDKLKSGAAYGAELAALEKLGVDPAKIEPLKVLVNGAPTGSALAASFEALAPKVLAAASPDDKSGGALDRLLAHMRGLVQVRDLSETSGDDPAALASQIEASSSRCDIAAALAAYGKLPEPARKAAAGWAAQANARQAAEAAVQSIREAAIGRLSGGDKS